MATGKAPALIHSSNTAADSSLGFLGDELASEGTDETCRASIVASKSGPSRWNRMKEDLSRQNPSAIRETIS